MEILYGICIAVLTLAVVAVAVQAVLTLRQVRETAEQVKYTAKALELSALNLNDRVESTRTLFKTIDAVTQSVRGGWIKGAQAAFSLFSVLRGASGK